METTGFYFEDKEWDSSYPDVLVLGNNPEVCHIVNTFKPHYNERKTLFYEFKQTRNLHFSERDGDVLMLLCSDGSRKCFTLKRSTRKQDTVIS